MKKTLLRNIVIALICAVLVGIIALTKDMNFATVRNGEEYTDIFLDGDIFEQELVLSHTGRITVSLLPSYQSPEDSVGIAYELHMNDAVEEGFIPLAECSNNQWTYLEIQTNNRGFSGQAQLILQAVGLDQENTTQFLIATNQLQRNPESLLYKNGEQIPNGRLDISYNAFDLKNLSYAFIAFIIVFLLTFAIPRLQGNIRRYPAAYTTMLLLIALGTFSYKLYKVNINKHVTAQYFFSWQNLHSLRRILPGTIIEFFNIDFSINKFIVYGILCIVAIAILECYILYNKRGLSDRSYMENTYWLFLCLPFSVVTPIVSFSSFGRFDELLIIMFLITCIFIINDKGIYLIPIIAIMGVLTHEMYLPLFIPFVFCLLLYKWNMTKNNKYIISLGITSIISIVLCIYVSFFSKTNVPLDVAYSNIQSRADPALVWEYSLNFSYYIDAYNALMEGINLLFVGKTFAKTALGALILAPIIFCVLSWYKTFFTIQKNRLSKCVVALLPCTLFGLAVTMYMTCDWGRIIYMYGVASYFAFLTLWHMDAENVRTALTTVWQNIKNKYGKKIFWGMCIAYAIISSIGGPHGAGNLFSIIDKMF